jgi:hypothetical protein
MNEVSFTRAKVHFSLPVKIDEGPEIKMPIFWWRMNIFFNQQSIIN